MLYIAARSPDHLTALPTISEVQMDHPFPPVDQGMDPDWRVSADHPETSREVDRMDSVAEAVQSSGLSMDLFISHFTHGI
jgi:hypothetical protein